jgi:hypothetical protein
MVARAVLVILSALVLVPSASAAAPTNLRGFLYKPNETQPVTHTFSRNPSFAWDSVSGASRYEFQLATSSTFADNAIVYENTKVPGPLTAVPVTLPWMTGAVYSWYARVRGVVNGVPTAWSARYGFNIRAKSAPVSLSVDNNPRPGMVRWTPIEGATAYEVVFLFEQSQGKSKKIKTATTAADLREYYSFHNDRSWANIVYWRVRAVREVEGKTLNRIPVVSYGPWSATNRTFEPDLATTEINVRGSISRSGGSDVVSSTPTGAPGPGPHALMPGFWWDGMLSPAPTNYGNCPDISAMVGSPTELCPLFHVYIYSDADCVNRVHASDVIGSPAYVPRLSRTLALPPDLTKLVGALGLWLGDGDEGTVFDAGAEKVFATGTEDDSSSSPTTPGVAKDRKTTLPDSDWATSRYYWTVVPVVMLVVDDKIEYHDAAFGQEMCEAGEVLPFGKTSAVAATGASGIPYVAGLTSGGVVRGATTTNPGFYGRPLIAWKPAPGAQRYEVQWSRKAYPWTTAGKVTTGATSAVLNLASGQWYFRVRGLDSTLPLVQGMTWSSPVAFRVLPRTFTIG